MGFDRDAGFSISYIRSTEYEAWARLNSVKISPSELSILKKIDRAFVAHMNGAPDEKPKTGLVAQLEALKKSKPSRTRKARP